MRRHDIAVVLCVIGCALYSGERGRAGETKDAAARAAWAWAQCSADCGGDCRPNAAWVWASVPVATPRAPLKSAADLGLEWRPVKDYVQLVRPGRCVGGRCTPDTLIGGWREGEYRPFAQGRWGTPTDPPCRTPIDEAASALASIMAGLIVEGFGDDGETKTQAEEETTLVAVSASRVVAIRPLAAPVRRLLALPIRALRSLRRDRAAAVGAASGRVVVTTTIIEQPAVQYLVFPEVTSKTIMESRRGDTRIVAAGRRAVSRPHQADRRARPAGGNHHDRARASPHRGLRAAATRRRHAGILLRDDARDHNSLIADAVIVTRSATRTIAAARQVRRANTPPFARHGCRLLRC